MSYIVNFIYKKLFSSDIDDWPSPYIGLMTYDARHRLICDIPDHQVVYNIATKNIIYQNPKDEWKVDCYQEIYHIAINDYILRPAFFEDDD